MGMWVVTCKFERGKKKLIFVIVALSSPMFVGISYGFLLQLV